MAPRKQWSREESIQLIELRSKRMIWRDIANQLPGRSEISCRLHYRKQLAAKDKMGQLTRLYKRHKAEMWSKIAKEMEVPWEKAEAMHWRLAPRAGEVSSSESSPTIGSPYLQRASSQDLLAGVTAADEPPFPSSPPPHPPLQSFHDRLAANADEPQSASSPPPSSHPQLPSFQDFIAGVPVDHKPVLAPLP
ncbi:SANT/Myb-like DNA-binding domain-containing protein [Aspergillus undulatus]|uniref:SANT/Myb-like DNA-binding domain-containing protein n=1 Tax=Aspergillus undulatus TaxID=1810928 RepID=UPI003CCD4D14